MDQGSGKRIFSVLALALVIASSTFAQTRDFRGGSRVPDGRQNTSQRPPHTPVQGASRFSVDPRRDDREFQPREPTRIDPRTIQATYAQPVEPTPRVEPPSRLATTHAETTATGAPLPGLTPSEAAKSDGSRGRSGNRYESIPLLPPDDPDSLSAPPPTPGSAIWTVVSSLTVVLGLFFAVVLVSRRGKGRSTGGLPKEAFEVLGRAPLNGRQQAQVVRFGDKLILLAVSVNGVESIGELTTPAEVDRIAGLCQQQRSDSVTSTFQQVLHQFSKEPTPNSFLGQATSDRPSNTTDEPLSEFERLA